VKPVKALYDHQHDIFDGDLLAHQHDMPIVLILKQKSTCIACRQTTKLFESESQRGPVVRDHEARSLPLSRFPNGHPEIMT
jgi:hypothetical protein